MHDVSLGYSVEDYLTGEQVEATTYEDLRQALAKLLVVEKGWPKDQLAPRQGITFEVDGCFYTRLVDFIARDGQGDPVCLVDFCAGAVSTFVREALAAARIHETGPIPLAIITDTKDAQLVAVADGRVLGEGMGALPRWEEVLALAKEHPLPPLTRERLQRERRICYAYSESRHGCCSHAAACQAARGGGAQSGSAGA